MEKKETKKMCISAEYRRMRKTTTDEIENRAATYCSLKRLERKAQKQEDRTI